MSDFITPAQFAAFNLKKIVIRPTRLIREAEGVGIEIVVNESVDGQALIDILEGAGIEYVVADARTTWVDQHELFQPRSLGEWLAQVIEDRKIGNVELRF